jgi:hypothetical protein
MDIIKVLLWIAIILFVFVMAWYVLGSSPTLDNIVFIFTIIFLIFNIKAEKDARLVKNKLDDIYNILKEKLK